MIHASRNFRGMREICALIFERRPRRHDPSGCAVAFRVADRRNAARRRRSAEKRADPETL
jgi:hypothetical protein